MGLPLTLASVGLPCAWQSARLIRSTSGGNRRTMGAPFLLTKCSIGEQSRFLSLLEIRFASLELHLEHGLSPALLLTKHYAF
jgi:hypothetical protein